MNTNPYKTNELLLLSIIVIAACSKPEANVPKGAIDLGLSVYWAECNLGAEKPEEDGDYYAWGEVETKEYYDWQQYKFCVTVSGTRRYLNKYTVSSPERADNKTVLESEDDVAHVKLTGKWRMPTVDEWQELITKSTCTLVNQRGVYGIKVTGPSGNSIFLPTVYGKDDGFKVYDPYRVLVNYWSSSLDTSHEYYAWGVYFDSADVIGIGRDTRKCGRYIRPVTE